LQASAIVVLVVLASAVPLLTNVGAREGLRSFAITAWRLPFPAKNGESADPTALGRSPGGRKAEEHPAPTIHWMPPAGVSWQWLPTRSVDFTQPVEVFDLPLATTPSSEVAMIHQHGAHAVLATFGIVSTTDRYLASLDKTLLGLPVKGYPDQRYLDIRRIADLKPFISANLDECWSKGFDGVDADALDTFSSGGASDSGFPIGYADQIALGHAVVALAHARGLAVGLHASPTTANRDAFVTDLEEITDFAVVDRCLGAPIKVERQATGSACVPFTPYLQHGKAVLEVEYLEDYPGATIAAPQLALDRFCPTALRLGLSSILKDGSGRNPSWRKPCPAPASPAATRRDR
jgi:hypothetical protein